MTTIYQVRYGALVSPANLSGESLEVQVFSSLNGDLVARSVEEGDVIAAISVNPDGDDFPDVYPTLYDVADGRLQLSAHQPQVGDLILTICSQDDVQHQAGSIVVVAENGTMTPVNFGQIAGAFAQVPQPSQANAVTPTADQSPVVITDGDGVVHVSADTSAGDVQVVLPSALTVREISVRNRNGNGAVEVTYGGETLAIIDSTALTHATFKSFGGGWDVLD